MGCIRRRASPAALRGHQTRRDEAPGQSHGGRLFRAFRGVLACAGASVRGLSGQCASSGASSRARARGVDRSPPCVDSGRVHGLVPDAAGCRSVRHPGRRGFNFGSAWSRSSASTRGRRTRAGRPARPTRGRVWVVGIRRRGRGPAPGHRHGRARFGAPSWSAWSSEGLRREDDGTEHGQHVHEQRAHALHRTPRNMLRWHSGHRT